MDKEALMRGLVRNFVGEADELVQRIIKDLLAVEANRAGGQPMAATYDSLNRGLHTLKGSAATVGLDALSELAHKMEDIVAPICRELRPFPAQLADVILKGLDVFMLRIAAEADGAAVLPDLSEVFTDLARFSSTGDPGTQAAPAQPAAAELLEAAPAQTADDQGSWRVSAAQVLGLLREVERLREVRLRIEERRQELDKVVAALSQFGTPAETAEVRALFSRVHRALGSDGEEVADLVDFLEDGVKSICTLPVRSITDPLHRALRDLCRNAGKEAQLSVIGGEVSLDRRVLDLLKGPLVHLVRNAVDHGIETPDVRMQRGKHRAGALVIRVEQQGNMVFVEVADDGNGLDTQRIREVALERGVVSSEELAGMSEQQAHQLIFRPGFSTRETVTEISGRGVGLDVVRAEVQRLQGQVEVSTIAKQGTRFILTVPVDLGSSPVMLVRAAEHLFGLPMLAVDQIVPAVRSRMQIGQNQIKITFRDTLLAVRDLGALMGLRQAEIPREGQSLLVLQSQGQRLAVSVDEVVGHRDIAIRPLPSEVRDVPAYQGAAALARGEVIMVLRPDVLVRGGAGEAAIAAVRRALVVDDSLTARALHRAMLESGGYAVHAVGSAQQAMQQLGTTTYDVVVCDIGMDDMDGLSLTRHIRQHPTSRGVPIILVSARDTDADREQGIAAGADGFLSKKDCAAGRLLAEVSAVIAQRQASRTAPRSGAQD